MFEQLEKAGTKLGMTMLVVVMLYAGCSRLLASENGSVILLAIFLCIPLWVIGRISWARRAHGRSCERPPRPRRRALPPPPIQGDDHFFDG
jgi:hypothetical protein